MLIHMRSVSPSLPSLPFLKLSSPPASIQCCGTSHDTHISVDRSPSDERQHDAFRLARDCSHFGPCFRSSHHPVLVGHHAAGILGSGIHYTPTAGTCDPASQQKVLIAESEVSLDRGRWDLGWIEALQNWRCTKPLSAVQRKPLDCGERYDMTVWRRRVWR